MVVNYTPATLPGWMRERLESFGPEMWYFKERQDERGTTRSVQRYENNKRYGVNPFQEHDIHWSGPRNSWMNYWSFLPICSQPLSPILCRHVYI